MKSEMLRKSKHLFRRSTEELLIKAHWLHLVVWLG